jgi:hypothetical protein
MNKKLFSRPVEIIEYLKVQCGGAQSKAKKPNAVDARRTRFSNR